jgi:imidazoleglycerol phosphate synthase glutamine amidotransferase subunit HisH
VPPAVQAVVPGVGRMEEDMARGSSVVMTVVGRTQKGAAFGLVVGRQPLSRKGRATASVDGRQGPVIGSVLA